jgi:adenylate cyclase
MKRLTLSGFFALATAAVVVVVAAAMMLLLRRSRLTILEESEKLQVAASQRVEARITDQLDRATRALSDLERGVTAGAITVGDPEALEAPLLIRLLADPPLEEISFTRATLRGYAGNGDADLSPGGHFQVAVQRSPGGALSTRVVQPGAVAPGASSADAPAATFVATTRHHALAGTFPSSPMGPPSAASDPTEDLTFSVIASRSLRGQTVWSDLHYAEADRALPIAQRRIVLTVQKAIFAAPGSSEVAASVASHSAPDGPLGPFLGVLRCGLLTQELDSVAQMKVDAQSADPQRVALLATTGRQQLRLVTRTSSEDRIEAADGDLRVVSSAPSAELTALLNSPLAAAIDAGAMRISGVIDVGGTPWRATLSKLPPVQGGIAGWVVAVLVVEAHYTRALVATQRNVVIAFAVTLGLLLLIGGVALTAVRRDLGKIIATTTRMRGFDFAPTGDVSHFRDVNEALAGLERAKTVVRAMGKYIPMDLVRRLYASNAEPELGGEPLDVSIMFTDIEHFTTLAEQLPVAELARSLGCYLEVMTEAIEATDGTIDKYIGDAVMAVWNAPSPVANHATRACAAALACIAATDELYASLRWRGLPPLVTRFGLHRARVLVGHFGAPTRLAYTALGDGVNLAARLEPLCKQYGVHLLVSEDIVAEANASFRFRRIDRVAVKGKRAAVDIFELIGPLEATPSNLSVLATYEACFTAYLTRDFAGAAERLEAQRAIDPPSAALAARCREFAQAPPPPQWDGTHVARSK